LFANGGSVEREKVDTLIAKRDEEYYFLDDVFEYKDGFKGATGTIVVPVSKDYYEYATSYDGIVERYLDSMGEDEWLDVLGLDKDDFEDEGEMIEAIEEGIYALYRNGELNPFEEPNYDMVEQMRDLPQFKNEDKYPIFEVIGGGRIFNKDNKFDKIYNKKLYNRIKTLEEFAQGGMTEHGLKVGDTIMGESKDLNAVFVRNNDQWHDVFLDKGTRYAKGGSVNYTKKWEVIGINRYGKKFKEMITLGRMSDKEDVKNALRRRSDLNISEITSIKEVFAKGGGVGSMLRNRRGK
jgi:hypothetical protein